MAEMSGTVTCLQANQFWGLTQVKDSAGETEVFLLWSDEPEVSVFDQIKRTMWISLLREAFSNSLPVTIFHPDNDARVESVQLGKLD